MKPLAETECVISCISFAQNVYIATYWANAMCLVLSADVCWHKHDWAFLSKDFWQVLAFFFLDYSFFLTLVGSCVLSLLPLVNNLITWDGVTAYFFKSKQFRFSNFQSTKARKWQRICWWIIEDPRTTPLQCCWSSPQRALPPVRSTNMKCWIKQFLFD